MDGRSINVPAYATRDPKVNGKLGLINYGLLNSIPANGKPFKIGIKIIRRDLDDPLKKTIDFLNSSGNEAIIKTYAANAIPYLSLIGSTLQSLYERFAPKEGDILFSLQPVTFDPPSSTDDMNAFTLSEKVYLVYRGTNPPSQDNLSIDKNGNILEKQADGSSKFLNRGPWVAFRIRKFSSRQDFVGREWQNRFEKSLEALISERARKGDFSDVERLLSEARVLLGSDVDFILQNRNDLIAKWEETIAKAKKKIVDGAHVQVSEAIKSSTVVATSLSETVTPVESSSITLTSEKSKAAGGGGGASGVSLKILMDKIRY